MPARPDTLASLGEGGLLQLLTGTWRPDRKKVPVGVGDDCAVLQGCGAKHHLLLKTDAIVEGVHFLPDARPEWIGHKALARALSDLAAMGGAPLAAVITLGTPAEASVRRLRQVYRGLEKTAKTFAVELVGGETTRAAQLFLSIALLGECRGYAPVLRSGGRAGDLLFVTGRLGATQRRHHLTFSPRLAEGQWLARHGWARAMMDVSDGLGADLPRLAQASRLKFELNAAAVPKRHGATLSAALNDGEDYELLFAVSRKKVDALKKEWPFSTALHCIGKLVDALPPHATPSPLHGFDHFVQRGSHSRPG